MLKLNQERKLRHKWYKPVLHVVGPDVEMTSNMDEPISEEVHSTTVIVDQGVVEENYFGVTNESTIGATPSEIRDFLGKDNILTPIVWSTSSNANDNLLTIDPSAVLLSGKYADKLYGMNMIRFNVEVTVKVNAYPFQAGCLLLHFLPCAGDFSAGWTTTRNINLTTKTQHPCIEIDAHESSKKMSIPYVTPYNYYDRLNDKYRIGKFYLDVLSPLTVGASGATTADITISYRFTDVELAAPMVPNSEKVAMSKTGSISQGLRATARVVNNLSAVPMLRAYSEPASWALRTAAGLASSFGYSKPIMDTAMVPVHSTQYRYSAVCDGPDDSIPLGVCNDNKLGVAHDVSIVPEDEMSMQYLLQKRYYYQSYTWGSATTTIYDAAIAPWNLYLQGTYSSGIKTATYKTGGPLYYLSNFFTYWRGSIRVRIKIVKTQFHTGRLVIVWSPTYGTTTAPSDSTFSLRHYIDIREADEIELELPFMVPQEFLGQSDSSGRLSILVQNVLRAPETCSSSVQVLMYFSAGSDFQFAGPFGINKSPPLMIGNMDNMLTSGSKVVSGVIGNERVPRPTLKSNLLCMGEHISSVKQLLNRNSFCGSTYTGTSVRITPWFHGASTTSGGSVTSTAPGGDVMSILGLMYTFFRGGVRVMLALTGSQGGAQLQEGTTSSPWVGAGGSNNPTNTWATPGSVNQGCYSFFSADSVNNIHCFLIPYYNGVRCSLLDFTVASTAAGIDPSVPLIGLNYVSNTSVATALIRSAGEDWQLSYFIGCPPLLTSLA